jgi:hypothetical protein
MTGELGESGFHYRCKVTIDGFCEETKKPILKEIDVRYYAGRQEPDNIKIVKKALRIATVQGLS